MAKHKIKYVKDPNPQSNIRWSYAKSSTNGAPKIVQLKSGHCFLNYHKSKFDTETKPNCQKCNSKEAPIHLLLDCNKSENERQKLKKPQKAFSIKTKWRYCTFLPPLFLLMILVQNFMLIKNHIETCV